MAEFLTAGALARATRVNRETIRYYERRGLLQRPMRSSAGYRQYPAAVAQRIRFIKHAQALGFSLEEIAELLRLRLKPNGSCAEVKARADQKIADIDRRIRALKEMQRALAAVAASCTGRGPSAECPILDALDQRAFANADH